MNKRNTVKQYILDNVLYTICKPQKTPKVQWTSKHLGKSDSIVAKATGRYNHA